ncbi:MAG: hypothetical protein IRZ09_04880 [Variibacter sp.]|nr:hypothetical protein [Variibacter sp.]
MQKVAADIANRFIEFAETAIALADADREEDLAALIASRAAIDSDVVLKALTAERPEVTAAVCRFAGLPLNSYSAVLRMRARKRRLKPEPSSLLAAYRQSTKASAAELRQLLKEAGCCDR